MQLSKLNSKKLALVIMLNKYDDKGDIIDSLDLNKFNQWLQLFSLQFTCEFFYIIHDNDFKENGERKKPHIHLILTSGYNMNASKVLNYLCEFLIISSDRVTIDNLINVLYQIRYLCHLDQSLYSSYKSRYSVKKICTNNFNVVKFAYLNDLACYSVDTFAYIIKNNKLYKFYDFINYIPINDRLSNSLFIYRTFNQALEKVAINGEL